MRGNESAYPTSSMMQENRGMTIRERFILAAMQGLLARDQLHEGTSVTPTREDTAVEAIRQADAMIAAMEKGDDE